MLLALVCCATAAQLAPNFRRNYTHFASLLHEDLLADYVKAVPPTSIRQVDYSEAGTDVKLQLRVFKLQSVSASEGRMQVKAWMRMWWTDQRLSWDPDQYGGITTIKFNAASFALPEDTEIWLPDIQPYNAMAGLYHTFDASMAVVDYKGHVLWSRPGTLDVMCRFMGLVMFPYGEFSCPIEVGGWVSGGSVQGLSSADSSVTSSPGCVAFDDEEETAMASYQEVNFVKVTCEEHVYTYPCCPNDPYPVIKYRIFMRRIASFYYLATIIPSTLFTLLSFSVFFMSFEAGERLGVGVTLVLTIEISRAALVSVLPICGEWLWLEMLFFVNLIFTIFAFLESCIVLGLSFTTEETLLPRPVRHMLLGASKLFLGERAAKDLHLGDEDDGQSLAGEYMRVGTLQAKQDARKQKLAALRAAQQQQGRSGASATTGRRRFNPLRLTSMLSRHEPSPPSAPAASRAYREIELKNVGDKLIFFENLFFSLDIDGGGTITFDEMRRMLAFTALTMSNEEREAALKAADSDRSDGKLSRHEFMDLCVRTMSSQPLEQLEHAAQSYAEYRDRLKRRANTRWRRIGDRIDRISRFWFPISYAIATCVITAVDLQDGHEPIISNTTLVPGSLQVVDPSSTTSRYEWLGSTTVRLQSPLGIVLAGLCGLLIVCWCAGRSYSAALERMQMVKMMQGSSTEEEYMKRASSTTLSRSKTAQLVVNAAGSATDDDA